MQRQKVFLILLVAAAVLVTGVKVVNQREAIILADAIEEHQVTESAEVTTKELKTEESTTVTSTTATTTEKETTTVATITTTTKPTTTEWDGPVLTKIAGTIMGPSGKETFYNLNMSKVIYYMKQRGYDYEYWVRDDGVKMYGKYIMVAANLKLRPYGTIVETSLGKGIVVDTGDFAASNPRQLDIAVTWVVKK